MTLKVTSFYGYESDSNVDVHSQSLHNTTSIQIQLCKRVQGKEVKAAYKLLQVMNIIEGINSKELHTLTCSFLVADKTVAGSDTIKGTDPLNQKGEVQIVSTNRLNSLKSLDPNVTA